MAFHENKNAIGSGHISFDRGTTGL